MKYYIKVMDETKTFIPVRVHTTLLIPILKKMKELKWIK